MASWVRRSAALGLVGVLLAAGCGRGEDTVDEKPGKAVSEGKAKGEITVWAMGTEGEKLSVLAEAFMKENPEATVKVTAVPWDAAHDKIATAIAGGQTPDVSMIGTTWMGEFAKTDGLEPTPTDLVDSSGFFKGAWDTTVVNGTSYGVPWYVETRLLYVNKVVAEKAGVSAPKSWDELRAAFRAFQDEGGAKWGVSLHTGGEGAWQTVLPFVWQNGGDVLSGDSFGFESAQAIEALDFYKSLFTEGLAPKDLPQGAQESDFVKGKIGAFISGPWHIGILKEQGGGDTFELWQMPREQAGTSFVGGADLAVFKDAKNRDGAWKFISYLSRADVQVTWYQTVNDLPAVTKGWQDPALRDDPLLSAFGEQLKDAKSPPAIATWDQVAAAFDAEIEKLVKTDATPAEVAAAIQKKAGSIGTGA